MTTIRSGVLAASTRKPSRTRAWKASPWLLHAVQLALEPGGGGGGGHVQHDRQIGQKPAGRYAAHLPELPPTSSPPAWPW